METNNSLVKSKKISNKLAESKYKLGITEQKLFLYAIELINENDISFNNISFSLIDFSNYAGMDIKELYRDIKKITKNLMSTVITAQFGKDEWSMYNLTSRCNYKNGIVNIIFSDDMKPFLLDLKNHCFRQKLEAIIKFKSWYSIRLYQILKANKYKNTHKDGIKFDYINLREVLGIEKNEYKDFKNFRVRVLDVAQKEINENTDSDISFSYEKITNGRKVIGIKFDVDVKKSNSNLYLDDEYINNIKERMDFLKNESLSQGSIVEIYNMAVSCCPDNPYKYIEINYNYSISRNPKPVNIQAYLKKAIESDYGQALKQIKHGIYV